MIVLLILVILALLVGGLLAFLMVRDPGYVLVSYDGATLETSLWFALACAIVLGLAVYLVAFLIRRTARGGVAVSGWFRWRRVAKARNRSLEGFMLFAEGRWRDAKQAFLDSADRVDTPLANYLAAAQAANELGRFEERDEILSRAAASTPQAALAVELVRAELQQAVGQWGRSIATLNALRRKASRHPLVLRRLFEAYQALGDWEAVAELAPVLPKESTANMADIEAATWRARFAKSKTSDDAAAHAREAWKAMPRNLRADEGLVLDYVDALAGTAPNEAEAVLRRRLKNDWNEAWVRRYGRIEADPAKQLATAKQWLKRRGDDASLLLTLGRLAAAAGDRDEAGEHLEASLAKREDPETLAALGALSAANGSQQAANDYYRRALALKE